MQKKRKTFFTKFTKFLVNERRPSSGRPFYQINSAFACSPLSMSRSCAVMERLTAVRKYAHSAISSADAHLGSSVCAMIRSQRVLSRMTRSLSGVVTRREKGCSPSPRSEQCEGRRFSYMRPCPPLLAAYSGNSAPLRALVNDKLTPNCQLSERVIYQVAICAVKFSQECARLVGA